MQVVEAAATLMGKNGIAEDRAALEKRHRQWRNRWEGHEASMSLEERTIEERLVTALTHAKAWTLSDAEKDALRQGCLTDLCRTAISKAPRAE